MSSAPEPESRSVSARLDGFGVRNALMNRSENRRCLARILVTTCSSQLHLRCYAKPNQISKSSRSDTRVRPSQGSENRQVTKKTSVMTEQLGASRKLDPMLDRPPTFTSEETRYDDWNSQVHSVNGSRGQIHHPTHTLQEQPRQPRDDRQSGTGPTCHQP